MSALPQTSSQPPGAPAGEWIDLEEAARRSQWNIGYIRRLCSDAKRAPAEGTLLSRGLARLAAPPTGGKRRLQVRADAHERFARVKFAEQIGTDLRQFTKKQRDRALWKRSILQRWETSCKAAFTLGFGRKAATHRFCEQLLLGGEGDVSPRTLYYWDLDYRGGGLAGLVDGRSKRGGDNDGPSAEDPFLAEVQRLWLSTRRPKLTRCHELATLMAAEKGWSVRTYKSCQRHIAKIPAAVVYKFRGGEEAYVNNAEPYLQRDYSTLESNEMWCSDHHQFDVLVSVTERLDSSTGEMVKRHVRPWLTVFQDLRSRKIVGWKVYRHDPNSDVIFEVFRSAIIDNGVPRKLLIDNGKDYDCYALNGRTKKDRWRKRRVRIELDAKRVGLFAELGIDVTHAQPYHGQSKPVERWFGTVEQANTCWPTYVGKDTSSKPDDLQLQLERGNAPSLEDFTEWFNDWVVAWNAGHRHQGDSMDGRTPDAVFAECLVSKRIAPRELLDLICMKIVGPVTVHQNGVTWKGIDYGQYLPQLHRLLDEKVMLRLGDSPAEVHVYTLEDKFVCVAASNAKIPANATRQDLREAMSNKRSDSQLRTKYHERRPRMAEDIPDRVIRAARAKAAAAKASCQPQDPPPSMSPVRHRLEGELPAIRRAVESGITRVAVGAESLLPRTFNYASTSHTGDDEVDLPTAGPSSLDSPLDYLKRHGGREDSSDE